MFKARLFDVVKWGVTLGQEPQTFLGASWIRAFLHRVSESKKRIWALRLLSMSPHYFIDAHNPAFRGMSNDEYLKRTFDIITETRNEIYAKVLKSRFESDFTVLDYGCGPGFLAKAAAPFVKQIYAIDISQGAVACAAIVNPAENIRYLVADEEGLSKIPDSSLDAVYSFAVIQHLTDETFEHVLKNCHQKLKPNALLALHIQLIDDIWQTEEDWKNNASLKGKVKYKYGLHCFGRTEEQHIDLVSKNGFSEIEIIKLNDLFQRDSDELHSQRLLVAQKNT